MGEEEEKIPLRWLSCLVKRKSEKEEEKDGGGWPREGGGGGEETNSSSLSYCYNSLLATTQYGTVGKPSGLLYTWPYLPTYMCVLLLVLLCSTNSGKDLYQPSFSPLGILAKYMLYQKKRKQRRRLYPNRSSFFPGLGSKHT